MISFKGELLAHSSSISHTGFVLFAFVVSKPASLSLPFSCALSWQGLYLLLLLLLQHLVRARHEVGAPQISSKLR